MIAIANIAGTVAAVVAGAALLLLLQSVSTNFLVYPFSPSVAAAVAAAVAVAVAAVAGHFSSYLHCSMAIHQQRMKKTNGN